MVDLKKKDQEEYKIICAKLRHENPGASPERL